MNAKPIGKSVLLSTTLFLALASTAQGNDGALLKLKVSSEALPEAGTTKRASVESSVLVAFDEKFAMQTSPFRVELTATEEAPAAIVTVTLYDTRTETPVFVGTEKINVPALGSSTTHMTGADGTVYSVAVQFKLAQLPAGKP